MEYYIDPELRKSARDCIAEFLKDTANLERTRLEWSGKISGVARSYLEDVEIFFSHLRGKSPLENVSNGLLTREESFILFRFYEAFVTFFNENREQYRSDLEIVSDIKWKKISELAAEAYLKLNDF